MVARCGRKVLKESEARTEKVESSESLPFRPLIMQAFCNTVERGAIKKGSDHRTEREDKSHVENVVILS